MLKVCGTFTLGPMAEQRDSARMMSTAAKGDSSCGSSRMCTARTVMLVAPNELFTICSLRIAVSTPGMVMTVLAAGVWASGLPPSAASTSVIDPVEPSPSDRQVLVTASAVMAFNPTTMSATLAELVAKPEWSSAARLPPSVEALRTPVLSSRGWRRAPSFR